MLAQSRLKDSSSVLSRAALMRTEPIINFRNWPRSGEDQEFDVAHAGSTAEMLRLVITNGERSGFANVFFF